MNALFFAVIHQGIIATLQGSYSFPLDRSIMMRERSSGMYFISCYYLSKSIVDSMIYVLPSFLFSSIYYVNVGFQMKYHKFFLFILFMMLATLSSISITNMISCLCITIDLSTLMIAVMYEMMRLYSGWFISPFMMRFYPQFRFIQYISYIYYTFIGISLNENDDLVLECEDNEWTIMKNNQNEVISICKMSPLMNPPYSGDRFNEYYGYDGYSISGCILYLLVYIFVTRLIGYLALRYIKI